MKTVTILLMSMIFSCASLGEILTIIDLQSKAEKIEKECECRLFEKKSLSISFDKEYIKIENTKEKFSLRIKRGSNIIKSEYNTSYLKIEGREVTFDEIIENLKKLM